MRLQFGLLSPALTEAYSVKECTTADDLYDAAMGPIGVADGQCATCRCDALRCPGHFGHINLAEPLYNIMCMTQVHATLERTCAECSALTHDKRRKRLAATCRSCGAECTARVRYRVTGDRIYDRTHKGDVSAAAVELHLKRIADADLPVLGWDARWSRPEWAIITVLPVAPPCCRPTACTLSGGVTHDGLTGKYREIIRLNAHLRGVRRAPMYVRDDVRQQLQWTVTTMIDSYETQGGDVARNRHREQRAFFAGLRQRLTGKEGRLRRHLMGKRVDHCARTVVTGDPGIGLDEVGVPERIARVLTVAERVTSFNLERLRRCVKAGAGVVGGANYYEDKDGRMYNLRTFRLQELRVGDVVHRTLRDGDKVLMNRQPTLHRGSMMAHRVHILPGKTFRINLSATTPYNADFDGDELNMHVPQSIHAQAEAEQLLGVNSHLLSAQTNGTAVGLVQDALLGVYLLSRGDTFFARRDAQELLFAARPDEIPQLPVPAILKPRPRWTGKQLLSELLPRDLTLQSDRHVTVVDGQLLVGELTKKTVGRSGGPASIVNALARRGVLPTFIENAQRLAHAYLLVRGFSVGVGDCVISAAARDEISEIKRDIADVSDLDRARDRVGLAVNDSLTTHNAMKNMSDCGSKGSIVNMCQIAGLVGQQNVTSGKSRGRVAPRAFGVAQLPHFHRGDHGPVAGGFCGQSYLQGLKPAEFFFHAVSGREGIIDTACKTASTGYIQRKLVKALENIHIAYDGTTRNAGNRAVVQWAYGEGDRCDAARLISVEAEGARCALPFDVRELQSRAAKLPRWGDPVPDAAVRAFVATLPTARLRAYVEDALQLPLEFDSTQFAFLRGEIDRLLQTSRVQPGEAVGVLAAQCLGSQTTQLTLNTFHHTGIAAHANLGVPRLEELLHCSKRPKTPSMMLPPRAQLHAAILVGAAVKDVTHLYSALPPEDEAWFAAHGRLHGALSVKGCWIIRWTFGQAQPVDLWRRLERGAKGYVRFAATAAPAPRLVAVFHAKEYGSVRTLQRLVEATVASGVAAVKRVHPARDGFMITDGTDLRAAFAVLPQALARATTTNHPLDAFAVLGIEAARAVLLHEVRAVMNANGYVNPRHTALLVDVMTHSGELLAVTRHGGHKGDHVIKQCTFESTVKTFFDAACRARVDPLRGVSSKVLMGAAVPVGTALPSQLLLATDVLQRYALPPQHTRTQIAVEHVDSKSTPSLQPSVFFQPGAAGDDAEPLESPFCPLAFGVAASVDDDISVDAVMFSPARSQCDSSDDEAAARFSPVRSDSDESEADVAARPAKRQKVDTRPVAEMLAPNAAAYLLRAPHAGCSSVRRCDQKAAKFVFMGGLLDAK